MRHEIYERKWLSIFVQSWIDIIFFFNASVWRKGCSIISSLHQILNNKKMYSLARRQQT